MKRVLAPALVLLAAATIGCGGSVGALLATVPPPVELTGGSTGVVGVPNAGSYRGDLTVQRVTLVSDGATWTQTAVSTIGTSKAGAEIGKNGAIKLSRDGEAMVLFQGTMRAVPASNAGGGETNATLTGFDRRAERYPYTLTAGEPPTLRLVARANLEIRERQVEFDRYEFILTP